MNDMGTKIARKRKDLGMTQSEFAERLNVTRQTVGRWETGAILPDIEKIADIAGILGVSCDYLLRDEVSETDIAAAPAAVSRLLRAAEGRRVKLEFLEEAEEPSLINQVCTLAGFEGAWMRVTVSTGIAPGEKLIPVSSIRAITLLQED